MNVSRRDFLKFCSLSATVLGFSATDLLQMEEALANPSAPTVLWLQGGTCSGCTISFLNRISRTAPTSIGDLLINQVNLAYHPELTSLAGEDAVAQIEATYTKGNYILIVEGAVPTAFGGAPCWVWSYQGKDVTFLEAVQRLASRAAKTICIGNCSSFGGVPAAAPNPTKAKSVSAVLGKQTINIAGCPPHPDWTIWVISQLLLGKTVALDSYGRPTSLYGTTVHNRCPREERDEVSSYGKDGYCLRELGCRGPSTKSNCPISLWNNGVNWCIGANAPCIGCTDPAFPFASVLDPHGGD